jgi:hypothetical protein
VVLKKEREEREKREQREEMGAGRVKSGEEREREGVSK